MMSTATAFASRQSLREKLRDVLVDGVRSGTVDGDRAKEIAEDIVDTLELAPEDQTPADLLGQLCERYPAELASLKDQLASQELRAHDAEVAAQMALLIDAGNYQGAVSVAHGGEVPPIDPVPPAPPLPPAPPAPPVPPAAPIVDSVRAPVSSTFGAALKSVPAPAAVTGRLKGIASGALRSLAGFAQRAAERMAPPPATP